LAIKEDIGDEAGIANIWYRLAEIDLRQGEPANAISALNKASDIGARIAAPSIVMKAQLKLAEAYALLSRHDEAYSRHLLYVQIKDSLMSAEQKIKAEEIEAKYQNEQKAREIEILNKENKLKAVEVAKRAQERNYLIGLVIVFAILGTIIFWMYRSIRRSNDKLQELDQAKSSFFANISHEFRTPLTLLLGPIQDRLTNTADDNERREMEMMQRNAHKLLNLINQLLDLSKLEAGNLQLQVIQGDLNEHISSIASSFSSLAERKHIKYKRDIPAIPATTYFDPDAIEKIILNLLSNAFKFTPDGGTISIRITYAHKRANIIVADTGIGIEAFEFDRIFQQFYQVGKHNEYAGVSVGLGLSLTKELVELHHGSINVSSTPNKGSAFTIDLPINKHAFRSREFVSAPSPNKKADQWHASPENPLLADTTEITIDNSQEVILIVEDDLDMQRYIKKQMDHHYQVILVANGNEGLKMAREYIPDLIISVLMMPGIDGIEFCNTIKNEDKTSHIPVILLTAIADVETKSEGLACGADDHVVKPFDSKELLNRTGNLIHQRNILRAKFSKTMVFKPADIAVTSRDEKFLNTLTALMEKYMDDPALSVETLQNELGMSRMQLHRKIKALTNCSTTEFIRYQRLLRAAQLLSDSDLAVSEVCYQVGFSSLSYFTRTFKQHFGLAPLAYAMSQGSKPITGL